MKARWTNQGDISLETESVEDCILLTRLARSPEKEISWKGKGYSCDGNNYIKSLLIGRKGE